MVERRYQLRLYQLERGSSGGSVVGSELTATASVTASARRGSGASGSSYESLLEEDHLSGTGRDMFADVDKEYCALREQRADLQSRFDVAECESWTLHARRVVREVLFTLIISSYFHYNEHHSYEYCFLDCRILSFNLCSLFTFTVHRVQLHDHLWYLHSHPWVRVRMPRPLTVNTLCSSSVINLSVTGVPPVTTSTLAEPQGSSISAPAAAASSEGEDVKDTKGAGDEASTARSSGRGASTSKTPRRGPSGRAPISDPDARNSATGCIFYRLFRLEEISRTRKLVLIPVVPPATSSTSSSNEPAPPQQIDPESELVPSIQYLTTFSSETETGR